jgi:chitodextrinase
VLGLALLVIARPATAAIAYVQSASQTPASASSVAVKYAAAQGAGDLNVIIVGWNNSTARVNSITDSKGNPYLAAVAPTTLAGDATQVIYYAQNIAAAAAGANTVTVTFSAAVNAPDVRVVEYSGISTTALDVGVGATGIGTSLSSGAVVTSNANDLLVGANYIASVFAAVGSGYTKRLVTTPDSDLVEDRVVTAAGSYSATSTQGSSGWWVMQLAAFRAAGSGTDTTPPSAPGALTATAASSSQINLGWTASTDNVGVAGYIIKRCTGSGCTNFAQVGTSNTSTYNDTGLAASTSYSYQVYATDAAANVSTASNTATAITGSAVDTTPPTAPTSLTARAASSTQITLGWTLSTDNVGVTGYIVKRCSGAGCTNFAQVGTSTTTGYNDNSLAVSSSYSYQVFATDAAGNVSAASNTATAVTSTPDTTPPSVPGNLTATAVSSSQINLSWTASTDNVGVTGYLIERCTGSGCTNFAQITTTTATSYSNIALTTATSYNYRVRATDAASNLSGYSNTASASTLATAAIGFVQQAYATPHPSAATITVAFAAAQSAGDLNVVIIGWHDSTSTVQAVTDTKGNNYVPAVGPTVSSGNATQRIYYARSIAAAAAGANTLTVVMNAAPKSPDLRVVEYSGLDPNNPFDVGIGASGSSTAISSGTVTTSTASDLLVGADYIAGVTGTAGAGYTQRVVTSPDSDLVEDDIVAITGSYSASATQTSSGWWVMQLAAFRAAGSARDTTPPSAPTNLAATAVSSSQIGLSWTASTDNVGVTGYLVYRCGGAGCTNFAQVGTSSTTSYNDIGLGPSNSYSYEVFATDAASNVSAASNTASATTSAAPDTTPPSAPANLSATAASSTQANLSWTASIDNVGVTGYLVYRCGGAGCTNFAQVGSSSTSSYNDIGLGPSNSYSYEVFATDAASNVSAASNTASATTSAAPDTTPPSAPTNLAASAASSSQVNLTWTASTDNVGVSGYIIDRCTGSGCTNFAQVGTSSTTGYNDSGLAASTSYSYQVYATDAAFNVSAASNTASATTTSGGGDTTPPSAPGNLSATAASSSQINLSWTASTDNVGVTGYLIYRCTGSGCTNFAQVGTSSTTGYNDSGLAASSSYSYQVYATDAATNVSAASNTSTTVTSSAADTTPPTAPSSLTAAAASSTQITLGWTLSTDNVGVTGYIIYRCSGSGCTNFAQAGTSPTTAYNDIGLATSTSYSYQVYATDAAGNVSAASNTASATTSSSAPDTTPPSAPGNLTATAASSAQVNLSWSASTDNVGVTGYLVERCSGSACSGFAQIGTSSITGYTDSGLAPSSSYSYRVRATDAAGNLSGYSNTAGASTVSGLSIAVESNTLVDVNGNVVQLRGVNISGLEFVAIGDPSWANGSPWGNQTGTATPQWSIIASTWKANAVRLTLNEASWLGYTCINKTGVAVNPDPWGNYQATVEQSVAAANAAGLYVIIDLHWSAPGSTCPQGQDQMADQDHSLSFWTSVANTFKNNPAVMFDLFNEPTISSSNNNGYATGLDYWSIWLNGGTASQVNIGGVIIPGTWTSVGMNQLIATVRATGATNVVLAGGLNDASDLSGWLSHQPTDPLNQLALSWHCYNGTASESAYAQAVLGAGIPVIIGETGDKSSNGTTSAPIITNVTQWADANGASVLPWTWDDWSPTGGTTNMLIKDAIGTPTDGEGVTYKAWLTTHP